MPRLISNLANDTLQLSRYLTSVSILKSPDGSVVGSAGFTQVTKDIATGTVLYVENAGTVVCSQAELMAVPGFPEIYAGISKTFHDKKDSVDGVVTVDI